MAHEIKMPQLSDTMDAGKILSWNLNEGDTVNRGDILAEVETDKANLEIEAFHKGTLVQITVPAGETAQVGEIIAYIGEAGEEISPETKTAPVSEPEPLAEAPLQQAPQPSVPTATIGTPRSSDRVIASPLARRMARDKNIDLQAVQGSGPGGRIVSRDLKMVPSTSIPDPTPEATSPLNSEKLDTERTEGLTTPLSKMRETIARRMQESVREAPHFYTTISINMGEVFKLREILKTREELETPGVNHFIIKAAAYALQHEPRVNAAMRDGQLYQPPGINIGIITAIDDGLLIPVIKNANTLSLSDLAFEANAAIDRARAGRPTADDLRGGTFSISNMGMFDVENFTAIINPGQGAVLAISSTRETPIVQNGQIQIGKVMKVTLSVDHRIIDGIMSARFLKYLREGLECPALLSL